MKASKKLKRFFWYVQTIISVSSVEFENICSVVRAIQSSASDLCRDARN